MPFSGSKHFFRPLPSSRRCGLDRSQKQMEGHLHPADDPKALILSKESKAIVPDAKQIFKGRTPKQSKMLSKSSRVPFPQTYPAATAMAKEKEGKNIHDQSLCFATFGTHTKANRLSFSLHVLLLCPTTYFLHLQNQRVHIHHANSLWIESRFNESLFKNRRF